MLSELIYPTSVKRFLSDFWEKQPLHVARSARNWMRDLPEIVELDEIINFSSSPDPGNEDLRLVRAGEEMPVERTKDGRPEISAIYHAYATGWTVVVNALHRRTAAVARLASVLGVETGREIAVNLYFTPSNAQGFKAHTDGHDVFILQTEGSKSWRVWPPQYSLPLERQRVEIKQDALGSPTIEATLFRGHTLYIPRGHIHEGITTSEASVHLTVGVHVSHWLDLAHAALRVIAEKDERWRRTAPVVDVENPRQVEAIGRELALLFSSVDAPMVAAEAIRRCNRAGDQTRTVSPDPHFRIIEQARSLTIGTKVTRRLGLAPRFIPGNERSSLEFGGRSISAPSSVSSGLAFICAHPTFCAGELPDALSDESKIVLVRRLIHEGFLTLAQ